MREGSWDPEVLLHAFSGRASSWTVSISHYHDRPEIVDQMSFHEDGRCAGPVMGEPWNLFWYPSGSLRSEYFRQHGQQEVYNIYADGEAPPGSRGQKWARELICRWNAAKRADAEEQVLALQEAKAYHARLLQNLHAAESSGRFNDARLATSSMDTAASEVARLCRITGIAFSGEEFAPRSTKCGSEIWRVRNGF